MLRFYELIESNEALFADVPSQTHLLKHDIDVGDSQPIKQHPYHVNTDKRHHHKKQMEDMVQPDITEASSSPWSPLFACY